MINKNPPWSKEEELEGEEFLDILVNTFGDIGHPLVSAKSELIRIL